MKNLILTFLFPSLALAMPQKTLPVGGAVEFMAIGKPAFIKIHGTGAAAKGLFVVDGDKVAGQLDFELSSLNAGIETRNEHMKTKYLEVEKFPTATLALESVTKVSGWNP